MSIRAKTISLVCIVILCVLAGSVYISSGILLTRFDQMEKERAVINISRVAEAYDVEVANLKTKIADWSTWDDTYQFIADNNAAYAESNLQELTLQNLNIHDMVFVDGKKRVIDSRSIDDTSLKPTQTSPSLLTIATSSALSAVYSGTESIAGTVIVDKKAYIIVANPIVKSDGSGPSRGILLFTRSLSKEYIKRIGEIVKLPLEIITIPALDEVNDDLREELRIGEEQQVAIESEGIIEADHFEKDIFGKPALYFHLELPRDIHAQGIQAVRYIAYSTMGVGFIVLLLLIGILDRMILGRIISVSREISQVGKTTDAPLRLHEDTSADEISSLIAVVNTMLQTISISHQMLREEQVRVQQYLDTAGVMIVVLSMQGTVTVVNKRACSILGRSPGDLVGHNWFDMCIPQGEQTELRDRFRTLTQGETADLEYVESSVITKSGDIRLIGWHNSLLRNQNGEFIATISSGEDITERKKSELAIEQKNRELESTKKAMLNILEDEKHLEDQIIAERDQANTIVSTISEGLFVVDTEMVVQTVNGAAEKMIGVQKKDILGKKLMDITTIYKGNSEIPENERPLWRTLHTGESFQFGLEDDHYFEGARGRFPVAIATTALRQGDAIVGALITFHDISRDKEIKNTIEQTVVERTRDLEKEQARFTASIRSLSLGFILTDTVGKLVLANDIARSILSSGTIIESIEDIHHVFEGSLDILKLQESCLRDKSVQHIPSVQFQGRWVRLFMVPVLTQDDKKDVIGTVILVEDITERKVMERSKDEFFSIASHELRTPLTAIRGNTSMLMDIYGDALPDNDIKEMIRDIHDSSTRLIGIVNDFLHVSRLEQGKLEFKNTNFDLKHLVQESIAEFEGSAKEKHIQVRYEDSGDIPSVFADRDRTKQVLLNLIGNGIKFTESGEVVVRLVPIEAFVRVCITDTGRGIAHKNQLLLFRKFQQAGDSLYTRDTTGGTGLGLYISRLLVEGMGGEIWLEKSEEGNGSEFVFTVPIPKI